MTDKRTCEICGVQVSKYNFSRHNKTKKHMKKEMEQKKLLTSSEDTIAILKKQLEEQKKIIEQKDEMIKDLNKENQMLKNQQPQTVNNYNTIIVNVQNFNNEQIEFDDDFIYQMEDCNLSNQARRLKLQKYLNDNNVTKNIVKTNMRSKHIHIYDNNKWLIKPQNLIITQRINNLPLIYRKSMYKTIKGWSEDEDTKEYQRIKHMKLAKEMEEYKYTKKEQEELKSLILCDAYNNFKMGSNFSY